jgi:BirA family biotin operon repressor/biotin-[acetyl-CoA-carboxylase] ligase
VPRIDHHSHLDSTSLHARRAIEAGHLSGPTIIVADHQTGGIGRRGERWHSPAGGLWMTLAWPLPTPRTGATHAHWAATLGLRLGAATLRALLPITGASHALQLKLPNDLVHAGAKLGGLLTELIAGAGAPAERWCLVGVGINANLSPEQLPTDLRYPATSLLQRTGTITNLRSLRDDLGDNLLRALESPALSEADVELINARLFMRDQPVQVRAAGQALRATLLGIDCQGALRVLDGATERTLAPGAEVAWPDGHA